MPEYAYICVTCNTTQHIYAFHDATQCNTHCTTMQHNATYIRVPWRNTMQHTLHHDATQCNALHHTAAHCNKHSYIRAVTHANAYTWVGMNLKKMHSRVPNPKSKDVHIWMCYSTHIMSHSTHVGVLNKTTCQSMWERVCLFMCICLVLTYTTQVYVCIGHSNQRMSYVIPREDFGRMIFKNKIPHRFQIFTK